MASLHTLTLTRLALHLLAQCLSDHGPCTTTQKTVLHAKVWQKIRAANDRIVAGHDVDNQFAAEPGESQEALAARVKAFNAAFKVWESEPVTITLSDKYRDACRDAVSWCHEHKDKSAGKVAGVHGAQLLVELGLATAEHDET